MRPDRTPRRRTLSVGAGLLAHGSRLQVRPSQRPKTPVTRNGPSARRSQLRGQRRHHTGFPLSSASPESDAQNLDLSMRRAPDAKVKKHIRISLWVLAASAIAHAFQLVWVMAARAHQILNRISFDLGLPQTPREFRRPTILRLREGTGEAHELLAYALITITNSRRFVGN